MTETADSETANASRTTLTGLPLPVLCGDSRLELTDLSIVKQGDAFIVGDPTQGAFVQLPQIGVTVIELLRAGASIAEVTATFRTDAASAAAGSTSNEDTADNSGDVDVLDFANTLLELNFVRAVDSITVASTVTDGVQPRWVNGPRRELINWMFSWPAWCLYSLLFLGCVAIEIVSPSYRPHSSDFFFLGDPLVSVAILTLISFATVGGHECFHWLAGCAQGVSARFAISRRLYFLVFETDLTQLWSVPRRHRYGPLLAGMAFDSTVLAASIVGRMLVTADGTAGRLLAAVTILIITNLVWQFCFFLRNDLYLVLSTLLGCVNLWRIAMLMIKRTLLRLTADEKAELDSADDRSRWHARWYSWICVAGFIVAGWYAAYTVAPAIWRVVRSLTTHLTRLPMTNPQFWEAVAFGVLALLPLFLMLYTLFRDLRNNLTSARAAATRADESAG